MSVMDKAARAMLRDIDSIVRADTPNPKDAENTLSRILDVLDHPVGYVDAEVRRTDREAAA